MLRSAVPVVRASLHSTDHLPPSKKPLDFKKLFCCWLRSSSSHVHYPTLVGATTAKKTTKLRQATFCRLSRCRPLCFGRLLSATAIHSARCGRATSLIIVFLVSVTRSQPFTKLHSVTFCSQSVVAFALPQHRPDAPQKNSTALRLFCGAWGCYHKNRLSKALFFIRLLPPFFFN